MRGLGAKGTSRGGKALARRRGWLSEGGGIDNPDQRITDDVRLFVTQSTAFTLQLTAKVFNMAAFCGVLAAMLVVLWYALPYLLHSAEAAQTAQDFLSVMAWFVPFELFGYVFVFISIGLGRTFWVGVISVLSIPLLIALTWAFAFGNLGFEAIRKICL